MNEERQGGAMSLGSDWVFGVPADPGWYLLDVPAASSEPPFVLRYWNGTDWRDRKNGGTCCRMNGSKWHHPVPGKAPSDERRMVAADCGHFVPTSMGNGLCSAIALRPQVQATTGCPGKCKLFSRWPEVQP
jgi:hypothetical protein